MLESLKQKFEEMANEKFSEQACLNFFGSLNEVDINILLEQLSKEGFPLLNSEQKDFFIIYLKKLHEKIEEKKRYS